MQILENKTVIITGGSRGIGRVLALKLIKEKMNIVITGRTSSDLNKTEKEISDIGYKNMLAIVSDVSIPADAMKIAKLTAEKFGNIHFLVNNAAVYPHKLFKDFSEAEMEEIIRINVLGTINMSKVCIPYMEKLSKTTGASVINIASTSGKRGYETGTAYSASKFAITGFSESLFKEVRDKNIRVTVIYPSLVDTKIVDEDNQKTSGKGVLMRAEDVAECIIFAMKIPQRAMLKEIEIWGTNP